jgi:hypothetical protein
MSNEIWRDCVGFEGRYAVSNLGRVKTFVSQFGREFLSCYSKRGDDYLRVNLWRDGKKHVRLVHTLVDEAFNGPRVLGLEVNHDDGRKTNAALSNLERMTREANLKHAYATGLKVGLKGERNGRAVLDAATVHAIRRSVGDLSGRRLPNGLCSRLARQHGVSAGAMSHLLHGRCWVDGGTA